MNGIHYMSVMVGDEEQRLKKALKRNKIRKGNYSKTKKMIYGSINIVTYVVITDNDTYENIINEAGMIKIL